MPRIPNIAEGVCNVIASGDCFAMRPEMTETDPFRSDASNWPLCVVESNAKRSSDNALLGPADSSESSLIVIPTDPSAPVVMTSDVCSRTPTAPGNDCAARRTVTDPLEILI